MSDRSKWFVVAALFVSLAGCDGAGFLLDLVLPTNVTIRLVNDTGEFDVEATLRYADDDDIFSFILTEFGVEETFVIPPGEAVLIRKDCDELQAIMIEDADLLVFGLSVVDTETDVLRDGQDFECGDEIVFTFTRSAESGDFDVFVDVLR